jgi:hypothetical protein
VTEEQLHSDVNELTRRKRREGEDLWVFELIVERHKSAEEAPSDRPRNEVVIWEAAVR